MLDWLFRPSCPCDAAAKEWVEERLQWLAEEFDDSAFSGRRIVLPTHEFFPDAYDGSNKSVRLMLDRVCEYMDVDSHTITLNFTSNNDQAFLVNGAGHYLPPSAAGTYEQGDETFIIHIDKSGLADPMGLVGTIAHELSHVRLLGEGRADYSDYDNELLTDLTVVHFGLGVFLANNPRNWMSQDTYWPDIELRKPEYMNLPMFAWALAHLAWFRGEDRLDWARHLNGAARANLKQGLRYLNATGDSTYRPARAQRRGKSV